MRTLLLVALMSVGLAALAGCGHTYGDDPFNGHENAYGERPAYFDTPQPGLGVHNSDDR
jgi:hypothetical protein